MNIRLVSTLTAAAFVAAVPAVRAGWPCCAPCVPFEQRKVVRYRTEYRTEQRPVQKTVYRTVEVTEMREFEETFLVEDWQDEERERTIFRLDQKEESRPRDVFYGECKTEKRTKDLFFENPTTEERTKIKVYGHTELVPKKKRYACFSTVYTPACCAGGCPLQALCHHVTAVHTSIAYVEQIILDPKDETYKVPVCEYKTKEQTYEVPVFEITSKEKDCKVPVCEYKAEDKKDKVKVLGYKEQTRKEKLPVIVRKQVPETVTEWVYERVCVQVPYEETVWVPVCK
jgi:hypothetical protein